MAEEQVPQWAQKILTDLAVLNSSLPNHITWTERNVQDHERRIRTLEQFRWMIVGVVSVAGVLGGLIAKLIG